jgi:hypothetical protein
MKPRGREGNSGAVFDPTYAYRYALWRAWDAALPRLCFIMLNPSQADAERDDPTIRRCIGFARDWGYGALEVVNLFAYCAIAPTDLRRTANPIGPENDAHIVRAVKAAARTVIAWGNHGAFLGRDKAVTPLLGRSYCLGVTGAGHPRHPLYVRRDAGTVPWCG